MEKIVTRTTTQKVVEATAGDRVVPVSTIDEDTRGRICGHKHIIASAAIDTLDFRRGEIQREAGHPLHDNCVDTGSPADQQIGRIDVETVVSVSPP
ncbi:hypothetical protein TSH64_16290 [Azospirillum sp. TSH64]|nr:hypothetical protein TSH64_16290 [Azospirillum sp. TSH64]